MDCQTEVTGRVKLFEDGVYRWIYEMDMRDNRFMYYKVLKILLAVSAGIMALCLSMGLFMNGDALGFLAALGFGISALMLLSWVIAYRVRSALGRGGYPLYYEMTKTEVAVIPTASSQKRFSPVPAKDVPLEASVPQAAERARIGTQKGRTGRGVTPLSSVRSVEPHRDQDVIDLHSPAGGVQVYARPEDFEFVLRFLRQHCPKSQRN